MPLSKPVFFRSDRLPRWRASFLALWLRARLKFRRHPGFVMAAVAGSAGLVLTLAVLAGLGRQPEIDPSAEEDLAPRLGGSVDSSAAVAEGDSSHGDEGWMSDPFDSVDSGRRAVADKRPVARPVASRPKPFDDLDEFDERESKPQPSKYVVDDRPPARRLSLPLVVEDEPEDTEVDPLPADAEKRNDPQDEPDEPAVTAEASGRDGDFPPPVSTPRRLPGRPLSAGRAASNRDSVSLDSEDEEAPPFRRAPTVAGKSSGAASELAGEADADDPKVIEQSSRPKVGSRQPQLPKVFEDEPEGTDTTGDVFREPRRKRDASESSTESDEPVREKAEAEQVHSREVETAVYATPEPKSSPSKSPQPKSIPAGRSPAPSSISDAPVSDAPVSDATVPRNPVAIRIIAPSRVAAGQTFDVDLIVTNDGRSGVRDGVLTVTLPEGLSHPKGDVLEQDVDSLSPRGMHRARLTLKATAAGEVTLRTRFAAAGEKSEAQASLTLRIGETRSTRISELPPCDCLPLR